MGRKLDMIGQRFGRLTVIGDSGHRSSGNVCWRCICDCGNEVIVRTAALRGGITISCGCVRKSRAAPNLSTIPTKDKLMIAGGTNGSRIRATKPQKNNTSGIRGVVQARKRGKLLNMWIAYIDYKGTRYYLGSYPTIAEAAAARAAAEVARLQDFDSWYAENSPKK